MGLKGHMLRRTVFYRTEKNHLSNRHFSFFYSVLSFVLCRHSFTRNTEPIFQQMSIYEFKNTFMKGLITKTPELKSKKFVLINWIVGWSRNESAKILWFYPLLQNFCWQWRLGRDYLNVLFNDFSVHKKNGSEQVKSPAKDWRSWSRFQAHNIPCKMNSINPCVFSWQIPSTSPTCDAVSISSVWLAKNQLLVWFFPLYYEFWFFGSRLAGFQWIVERPHQVSELIERPPLATRDRNDNLRGP